MVMLTAEQRRVREGEIVAQLGLIYFRATLRSYAPTGKNLNELMPELYVLLAVRHEQRRHPAASIAALVKITGFKRSSVRRYTQRLKQQGAVREAPHRGRNGSEYVINPRYRGARIDAPHIRIMRRAIVAAARALTKNSSI
jgi:hypothetical protein